jgi:aminopeptidase YwaD
MFPTTLLTLALLATVPAAAAAPADIAATIDRAALMQTVEHMASREFQGRLAGSPGYMKAAREMAERFRRAGLAPGGDGGSGTQAYFQGLEIEYTDIETCRLAVVGADGKPRALALGPDFTCRGFTGSAQLSAPVVFVGYGLSEPGKGYDDYAGVDVRDKVVLALKEPPPFTADSAGWGDAPLPRPKGLVAAAHGAVALLLVSRPDQPHPQKPIASTLEGEAREDERFPRLQVSVEVAAELARTAGLDLAALAARIDSTKAPASHALPVNVRIGVAAHYHARQPSVNVVGVLEGSDPVLKHEYVVLGAHLDHVGSQGREIYFPGANDNASGSAAVTAIAEAVARSGARPKRSLVFGLWSSEESGLQGAKRFVARPPVPRDSLVAYLNFDCVGHGDSIEVGGGKAYPKLWQVARDLDATGPRLMVAETWGGGGADAQPFEKAGIPNLYFASKFSYTHLHLTSDTPATLDPALLEAIARLGCATALRLAEAGPPAE